MADLTFRPEIKVICAADGVRRRHWSDADKLRIVEESFVGHRQANATARRHGFFRSLLTTWRRQFRNGEIGAMRTTMLTPVSVVAVEWAKADVQAACFETPSLPSSTAARVTAIHATLAK